MENEREMPGRGRRAVTVGVMTGSFLAALEATVVGTAMPTVIASLGGMNHYSWVFTAYLIASTVTVPIWGKLSDLYGRRLFYQLGVAIFLTGSILSGAAHNMAQLIAFRALQGLGAGGLIPLGMTIIGDIYTLDERARMQALFSGVWGLSSIVGPLIGGFITDQLSWRWVFYLNVPFGITAAVIIGLSLVEPKRRRRPVIDYLGAGLLTAAVTLLMLALVEGGQTAAALLRPRNLAVAVAGLALAFLFLRVERRAKEPVLPLPLFRNRVVAVAVVAGFLAGAAMFGAVSFTPLFAQGALGFSATQAGALLTPLMLSWVTMSVIGGRLLLRIGFRPTTIAGFIVLTAGFAVLASYHLGLTRGWLYAGLILIGTGLGLTMLTLLIAVQHSVPREQLGIATSLNQFSRSIGAAVGVAVMGAILSGSLSAELTKAAAPAGALSPARAAQLAENPSALIDPQARTALPPDVLRTLQRSMGDAIRNVFRLAAVLALLGLFCSFLLPRAGKVAPGEPARDWPSQRSREAGADHPS
jgi:EmrB/QacA subfamily drug resistance transporter